MVLTDDDDDDDDDDPGYCNMPWLVLHYYYGHTGGIQYTASLSLQTTLKNKNGPKKRRKNEKTARYVQAVVEATQGFKACMCVVARSAL